MKLPRGCGPSLVLLVCFTLVSPGFCADEVKEARWETLFNGKDLTGWAPVHDVTFVATNGNLRLVSGMGWLRTEKQYSDFILEFEWRALEPGYDSGIFIRAGLEGKPWPEGGWQVNLKDSALGGLVKGYKTVVPAETPKLPVNQWVKFHLEVRGKKVSLTVNGEPNWDFAELDSARGYIGIQAENKAFDFRNFRLQELSGESAGGASDLTPAAILGTMERVADWQLANPSAHKPTDWTCGAGYAGFMALADCAASPKYLDAMRAMGETNGWKLGPRKFHADDHCVGQTYVELYRRFHDNRMIAHMRERFDDILAHPSTTTSLDFSQPKGKATELWSWCDALFMGPPALIRLWAATGDERYLDFAVTNWWRTSDYLYDKEEHLYFRDSTYFTKREANGKKVFWSRGNGWVMGGLVRMLQYLPAQHPARERFVQQFREMAEKVLTCQQDDGLWRSSLLDPASYSLKETSGSGFYTYALAWGVNQGLLDRARFEPAVQRAWRALVACVQPDGKLTHVQPIGADPKKFDENSTEIYGVGAFLLAGSEMYRAAGGSPNSQPR